MNTNIGDEGAPFTSAAPVRLPFGMMAGVIIVADYFGWGFPPLTAIAVLLIMVFQVFLSVLYLAMLWKTTKHRIPRLYGPSLMSRYLYVCGFALVYALTEHWWLASFQGVVLVTLTAFVIEHKGNVDMDR